MQLRSRPLHAVGVTGEQSDHQQHACCKHHGPQAPGEYLALRGLQQRGKPCCDRGNSRKTGCHDAHALCSRYTRAVAAGVTDGAAGKHAQFAKQLQAYVYVGGSHPGGGARTIHGNDSLNLPCLNTFSR